MVGIISSNGLGLGMGSLAALGFGRAGQGASAGASKEQVYLNLANGNLVVHHQDGTLLGLGSNQASERTYNSQGGVEACSGDGWLLGKGKTLVRLDAKTLLRTEGDGTTATYALDVATGLYAATRSPGGAVSTVQVNTNGTFTWTHGASGATETYEGAGAGLLQSSADAEGNVTTYAYEGTLLTRVTNADGEAIRYHYVGSNLTNMSTVLKSGQAVNEVSYGYDDLNRLTSVTVTLSPEGAAGAAGATTYTTTYTYEGTSDRVTGIEQSDGTRLSFTYALVNGTYQVASYSEGGLERTYLAYSPATNETWTIDSLGVTTVYVYNDKAELTEVRTGVTAGNPKGLTQVNYAYNALGDVTAITDGQGNVTTRSYDANGNLTSQVDAAGGTVRSTYNAANQIQTETLFALAAHGGTPAGQPLTTRYVYAGDNATLLRFLISAEGEVTEYRYDAQGLRTCSIVYSAGKFATDALGQTEVPTEAQMGAWRSAQDLVQSRRMDFSYDFRGQLQSATTYGATNADGTGVAATASRTQYTYNQRGELLQALSADGLESTVYVYDGLGRVLSAVTRSADGTLSRSTHTTYSDSNNKVTVTQANGLATTSLFDAAGRLVSVLQTSGETVLGTTRYAYDVDGRLLMTTFANGQHLWHLYDAAGRKVADINAEGGLTEYVYNGDNQVTETIRYATAVNTRGLVDGSGNPTTGYNPISGEGPASYAPYLLASLRPAASPQDETSWTLYDAAGRLVWQVDAQGYVTQTQYDGASRVLATTRLATPIDTRSLGNGVGVTLALAGYFSSTRLEETLTGTWANAPRQLTATVTSGNPGTTPAGTVSFFAGSLLLGTAALVNGVARFSAVNPPVGSYAITAVYSGDPNTLGSTSNGVQDTVTALPETRTTLAVTGTSAAGSSLTLTATVAGQVPSGLVRFFSNGVAIGSATVTGGVAALRINNLPIGSCDLTATYEGDGGNAASSAGMVHQVIVPASATVVLSATASLASEGQSLPRGPVTLVARVTGANPTGRVTFMNGATLLGTVDLSNGLAALVVNDLPTGMNHLTASYSGDGANANATSAMVNETVLRTSFLALAASSQAVALGTPLTLTATVSGNSPTGTVAFFNGAKLLGSAVLVDGVASLTLADLPLGINGITGVYSGDGTHTASASVAPLLESVLAAPTTTTLATSSPRNTAGEVLVLTATVRNGAGGLFPDAKPTGTVEFFNGSTKLGSAVIVDGTATLVVNTLPMGLAKLSATYDGDGNNVFSYSNVVSEPVAPAMTRLLVTSGATLAADGMLVVQVEGLNPTGTVTFLRGTTILGTATVSNGKALISAEDLPSGGGALTATYSGDANNLTGVLDFSVAVAPKPTRVVLIASTTTSTPGAPVVLNAQVTGDGRVAATGTVTFLSGTTVLGTGTLCAGLAAITLSTLPLGSNRLTVQYGGDPRYAANLSAEVVATVAATPVASRTVLSTSTGSVVQGVPFTLTANVTSTGDAPTGTVTFLNGQTVLGTANLVGGVATLVTSLLTAGAASLRATYSGDSSTPTSVGDALAVTVTAAAAPPAVPEPAPGTVTALAASVATCTSGSPVTFTATITGGTAGIAPTGTVSFFRGTTVIGSAMVVDGKAMFTSSTLLVGVNTIKAVYSGDGNSASSISGAISELVKPFKGGPVIGAIDLFPSTYNLEPGGQLILSARVAGTATNPATGQVTFYNGATVLGTGTVVDGLATLTVSGMPTGMASLTARYGGDTYNAAITSLASTVSVAAPLPASTTSLGVSSSTAALGAAVTLTAAVAGSTPGGTVCFFTGATLLGSALVTNGMATLVVWNLPLGVNSLTAVFSGDARNVASASAAVVATVQEAAQAAGAPPEAPAPASSPAPVVSGNGAAASLPRPELSVLSGGSIALNATLAIRVAGDHAGGIITFLDGSTILGSATVVDGVASFAAVFLPLGSHFLSASYSGDDRNLGSVLSFSQTVTASSTHTVLTTSPADYQTQARPFLLTAQVMGINPSGTVTFYSGSSVLGTATLSNGLAAMTVDQLPVGLAKLTAVYSGDERNVANTSAPLAEEIIPEALTPEAVRVTVSSSAAEVPQGGAVTLTARVEGKAPSGLVTFIAGGTVLGSAALVDGIATLRIEALNLPVGTAGIVANYLGDPGNGACGSQAQSVTVGAGTRILQVGQILADRVSTNLHDRDGRLSAVIDAEGYLTRYRYNASGQLVETTAYGNRIAGFSSSASIASLVAEARQTGSLSGLLKAVGSGPAISTYRYYNTRGQLVGQVDGAGHLTETVYDANGRVAQSIRYATPASTANGPLSATSTLAALRPASTPKDQVILKSYDALGRLYRETNAEGTVTQYGYDGMGNQVSAVTAVNTSDQRTLLTQFNAQGQVVAELSGAGAALITGDRTQEEIAQIWVDWRISYTYDATGNRTSQTDPQGHRTVYFYDNVGRLRITVDPAGQVTELTYDALGHVASRTAFASVLSGPVLAHLEGGLLSAASNAAAAEAIGVARNAAEAANNTTAYAYDGDGRLVQTTDALGGVVTSAYNPFGEVSSRTQSLDGTESVTVATSHDRRGLATDTVSDAGGLSLATHAEYDAFGRLVRATDAAGKVTQVAYDPAGRQVSVTDPAGNTRSTSYDAFDRVLTQTDALGNTTAYSYSDATRSLTVTTPEGLTMTTVHNREGQSQSVTDGNGNTTCYRYDPDGRLLSVTGPASAGTPVTENRYDSAGRIAQSRDARGMITDYSYDADNRLLMRVVDPVGLREITTYQYDALGREISVTDPKGIITRIAYDPKGEVLSQVVDPDGLNLTTSYRYDQAGRLLTVTTPGGTQTQYVYDHLGRRTETIVDPGGLQLVTGYTYDDAGHLAAVRDPGGVVTRYAYDSNDRLVYVVNGAGQITRTDYDYVGRVIRVSVFAQAITLDGLAMATSPAQIEGRLQGVLDLASVEHRIYDKDGRVTYSVDGLGAVTHLVYDGNGNVCDRIQYANPIDLSTWVPGTIPAVRLSPGQDVEVRTVYDGLNRALFTLSSRGDGSKVAVVAHTYDAAGNELTTTAYANGISAGTPATAKAISAALALTADPAKDATTCRLFDSGNRLIWSVDGQGEVTQRLYDADGRLVKQVAYMTPMAPPVAGQVLTEPPLVSVTGTDQVRLAAYDAAGRLTLEVDARGGVSQTFYDRNSNVIKRIAYATEAAAPTTVSSFPPVPKAAIGDRVTLAGYDAANRQAFAIDALGGVTENRYDANGRLIASVAFANPIAAGTLARLRETVTLNDIKAALPAMDDHDLIRLHAYDASGRERYSVDPRGFVTRNDYNGLGQLTETTLFTEPIALVRSGASVDQLDAAVAGLHARGQSRQMTYDAAGNLASITDANGAVTRYAYDACGRLLYTVDGVGGVTGTSYDSAGRVVTTVRFAETLRLSGLGTCVSAETLAKMLEGVSHLHDEFLTHIYANERQVYTLDGSGAVTLCSYDAVGNLVERTSYAKQISIGAWTPGTIPVMEKDPAHDQQVRTVYDTQHHALYTLSSTADGMMASVVAQTFDANGNLTGRTAFAGSIKAATLPTVADVRAALGAMAKQGSDQSGRYAYDAFNRLTWAVTGTGAVTQQVYDAAGHVVQRIQYATPIGATDEPSTVQGGSSDRVDWMVYDFAGRQTFHVNAMGGVTGMIYDAGGNLAETIAYATLIPAPTATHSEPSLGTLPPAPSAGDRVTRTVFDAANRAIYAIDARGDVTAYAYDGEGHVLSRTAYATPIRPEALATLPAVTRASDLEGTGTLQVSTMDRTTLFTYDEAGRQRYAIDALGYVVERQYDGLGRLASTVSYAAPTTGLVRGADSSAIDKAVAVARAGHPDLGPDRVNGYGYDAAGNLASATDPMGYAEHYSYDGVGNKVSFTNKLTKTWNYDYDAAGRMILKVDPEVSITQVGPDARGNLVAGSGANVRIETRQSYDGLGNLVERTEAANLAGSARTTKFRYDAMGRQIETTYPEVGVYLSADLDTIIYDGSGHQDRFEKHCETSVRIYYDVFGDAVANRDVGGNLSSKTYDALGQLCHEIDALGYVTTYERGNAFGEVTALTRYAKALTVNREVTDSEAKLPTLAEINARLAAPGFASSSDRVLQTQYDALGRATRVIQSSTWVNSGHGLGYQAAACTETRYNAFGEVALTRVLADAPADSWAITVNDYDLRGQLVAQLDPMGFLTTQEYDAAGNLTKQTQFAKALVGWDLNTSPGSLAGAGRPAPDPTDRTLRFTYDAANRKTCEIQVKVAYSELTTTATATDGIQAAVIARRSDLVTSYEYDALGNLTCTTDPLQNKTYTYFDALGRTLAVAAPAQAGTGLTPLTVFGRDAFGQAVVMTQYAKGAASLSGTSFQAAEANAADDRTTLTRYDSHGKAIQITDANGNSHFMSYTIQGQVAKTWQPVTDNDGRVRTLYKAYTYDALGRQTSIISPGSVSTVSLGKIVLQSQAQAGTTVMGMEYNAFGEVTRRGLSVKGAIQEADQVTYEYDNTGQLWRSNAGGGDVQVFLHDLQGRQTAQIKSSGGQGSATDLGFDLSLASLTAESIDRQGNLGLRRTDFTLDLQGRVVRETLPARLANDYATNIRPVIIQTFDRWGNILTQTDVRSLQEVPGDSGATTLKTIQNWKTVFTYNSRNQVISETQPDAQGEISESSPTTRIAYNALGEQVALTNARGVTSYQKWDGGQVVQEIHADSDATGGVIGHVYNAFGEQVTLQDALGNRTEYRYDHTGNTLSITSLDVEVATPNLDLTDVTVLAHQNVTTTMTYNEAGQKRTVVGGASGSTQYAYDLDGHVIATTNALGNVSRSVFDGLGRQTAQQDANGLLSTWTYQGGKLQGHTDLGGVSYSYAYDHAGQLVRQTNERGQNLTYAYDAAGQVVQITDGSAPSAVKTTYYAYNAAGKHVLEATTVGDTSYQHQTLSYDMLGRLASVDDNLSGIHLGYAYDQVGNLTHEHVEYQVHTVSNVPTVVYVFVGYRPNPNGTDNPETGDGDGAYQVPIYKAVTTGSHQVSNAEARSQDLYFAYDELNRAIMVDGASSSVGAPTTANLSATQGHLLSYDHNGNRISDTTFKKMVVKDYNNYLTPSGMVTDTYDYDAMGRLTAVKTQELINNVAPVAGHFVTLNTRAYDAASRVVKSGPSEATDRAYLKAWKGGSSDTGEVSTVITRYNEAGWVLAQKTSVATDDSHGSDSSVTNSHDAAGNLTGFVVTQGPLVSTYAINAAVDAEGRLYDGYLEGSTTVTITNQGGSSSDKTVSHYDANGFLIGVEDKGQSAENRTFINTTSGQALEKNQGGQLLEQLVVNGEVIGRYGYKANPSGNGAAPTYSVEGAFDLAYRPVTSDYPAATSGSYQVHGGDSLQSIAQEAYGDSSLWYLIAQANGLSDNSDLRVGQLLTIPSQVLGVHNTDSTHAPYNPAKIVGSSLPNLATPQASAGGGGGCGGLGTVLMIVVAAVVTYYTAGAATGWVTSLEGAMTSSTVVAGTTEAVVGGAIAGAAGSVASQAVGMGIGAQQDFSWNQVGMAALGGAVAGGINGAPLDGKTVGGLMPTFAGSQQPVVNALLSNAMTQGVEVATKMQSSFSWAQVMGAGVGAETGAAMGPQSGFSSRVGAGTVQGVAAGITTSVMNGGRIDIERVATDAFGNALGSGLADQMKPTPATPPVGMHSTGTGGVVSNNLMAGSSYASMTLDSPAFPSVGSDTSSAGGGLTMAQQAAFDAGQGMLTDAEAQRVMGMTPANLAPASLGSLLASIPSIPTPQTYTVRDGDSPWKIAAARNPGADNSTINAYKNQLLAANPGLGNDIWAGNVLNLPGADTPQDLGRATALDTQMAQRTQQRQATEESASLADRAQANARWLQDLYNGEDVSMVRDPRSLQAQSLMRGNLRESVELANAAQRVQAMNEGGPMLQADTLENQAARAWAIANDPRSPANWPGFAKATFIGTYGIGLMGLANSPFAAAAPSGVALQNLEMENYQWSKTSEYSPAKIRFDIGTNGYVDFSTGKPIPNAEVPWPRQEHGFQSVSSGRAPVGMILDRFGSLNGNYLGKPGASVSDRGLPPGTENRIYTQFEVIRPLPLQFGPAAPVPAFGARGGATQYFSDYTINELITAGYLKSK